MLMYVDMQFVAFGLTFAVDYAASKGLGELDKNIDHKWVPELKKAEYVFTVLYVSSTTKTPMNW